MPSVPHHIRGRERPLWGRLIRVQKSQVAERGKAEKAVGPVRIRVFVAKNGVLSVLTAVIRGG